MRQTIVYGLLTVASFARATPTRKLASPLARRDNPEPSHYPGGDSPECANEPLYLNFDMSKPGDTKRVQKIHSAYCNEVDLLLVAGSTAVNADDRTIYERFLPENNNDGPSKDEVNDVFNHLFDFSAQTPAAIVAGFIFDNVDWKGTCGETTGGSSGSEDDDDEEMEEGAYTGVDPGDQREKTHFCIASLEFENLGDITCNTLDSYPSDQMESTGRVMLHEFTHYSNVGPDTQLDDQIVDAKNKDKMYAYGASRAHGLEDPNQDNQPGLAQINADNYAWMSTNSWFKQSCTDAGQTPPNNGNFNDPPNYNQNQSGDPSDTGNGDNSGDNGCGSSNAPGCNGTPGDDNTYGIGEK